MLVYDITKRQSFVNIEKWLKEIKLNSDAQCIIILVGNKCDLESLRQVPTQEAKDYAQRCGLYFMETSAKDNINVDQAFSILVDEITKLNPMTVGLTAVAATTNQASDTTHDQDHTFHKDKDERRNLMNADVPKNSGCCILS